MFESTSKWVILKEILGTYTKSDNLSNKEGRWSLKFKSTLDMFSDQI